MRPSTPIPQDLRDRLDAAREWLDVDIDWVEQGDRRCFGRQFGFWTVIVAPYGWREQLAAYEAQPKVFGGAPAVEGPRWVCMLWPDLTHILAVALDKAERQWPAAA